MSASKTGSCKQFHMLALIMSPSIYLLPESSTAKQVYIIHAMQQSPLLHRMGNGSHPSSAEQTQSLHSVTLAVFAIMQVCDGSSAAAGLPHPQCPPARDGPKGGLLSLVTVSEPWVSGPKSLAPHMPCQGAL